ncbi:bifunctional folylpolyglutamate synthase/dihydrofolate synthase [Clostridium bornimense]|uniref:bifunctional folylpolyglutamate synthase/dihydrofolate synthase n=1 Tax=Clostridium bornimense TaxID=1216932 RepID=UPI001C105B76|nr:folylpolyglutamate synthase/dihydrofolate synthase family protein [Clostridium bornimense]MBU5315050.1 bifunctional folylpolyglutamate synthase/dihydrofolate synthase [Clostridium bornimense]
MNYRETMDYIHNTAKFGMNFGLKRTKRLLEYLGSPHEKLKCIHIAGTNGKGSTSAMVAEILKESGYKVGLYTSPFLEEFEERIQINSVNIPKEKLCSVIEKVSKAVDKVSKEGLGDPTEFEIITAAMFLYYYEENIDIAVVEVGLGGRLDSTNILDPILTVITSISYDHVGILGTTLKEIATEKAGIIKEGVPLVLYPVEEEAREAIVSVAKMKNCEINSVASNDAEFIKIIEEEKMYQVVRYNNEEYKLALLGTHQVINFSVVMKIVESLRKLGYTISNENVKNALKNVVWKGRMEVVANKPYILLDGAHNLGGIEKLKESLNKYFNYSKLILIIGILGDKDVEHMLEKIIPSAEEIITVTPNSPRAMSATELKSKIERITSKKVSSFDRYEEAFGYAKDISNEDDMILICGSLYMIGDMRKIVVKNVY